MDPGNRTSLMSLPPLTALGEALELVQSVKELTPRKKYEGQNDMFHRKIFRMVTDGLALSGIFDAFFASVGSPGSRRVCFWPAAACL